MRPSSILASTLLLAASSDAWSFFGTPERRDATTVAATAARPAKRQNTPFDLSFTGIQGQTDAPAEATRTGSALDGTITASASRGSNDDDDDEDELKTSFDPRLPAGGLSMLTPDALTGQKYFKIKDHITFAWNYTSLSIKPSYIDVLATCTQNQATYTIALNQTFQQTQEVIWDTGEYQATGTVPLLTETYTLIVHDADVAVSARPQPGYLGTYSQFSFGMYLPQKYTPMAEYVCATCSGAVGLAERQTMGFLFGMAVLTVLSFGWFAGVAGVW